MLACAGQDKISLDQLLVRLRPQFVELVEKGAAPGVTLSKNCRQSMNPYTRSRSAKAMGLYVAIGSCNSSLDEFKKEK
jgi:hypothetical protein